MTTLAQIDTTTIRTYRAGDEAEINRQFNEIFGATRSLDEWRWKFARNPLGKIMITVAEDNGAIAGHYATVPTRFQYLGETVHVAIPVDTFINPDFRGPMRGVLGALYQCQHELWDHRFGFGFPNPAAYVVGKRIMKYQDLGKMPVLARRLNLRQAVCRRVPWLPRPLLSLTRMASAFLFRLLISMRSTGLSQGVTTRIVDGFDERFDIFWERVKNDHKIVGVRDRRYLSWRYDKPGTDYQIIVAERGNEILGYAVTGARDENGARVGYIADLICVDAPSRIIAALVKAALLNLHARKVDFALCWMLPDKAAYPSLLEFGFRRRDEIFPPVNIVIGNFRSGKVAEDVLKTLENWYLTMGDSDTY